MECAAPPAHFMHLDLSKKSRVEALRLRPERSAHCEGFLYLRGGGAAEEQTRRRAGASRGSGHASAFAISSLYMAYFDVHSLAVISYLGLSIL